MKTYIPNAVAAPAGPYSHGVEIPATARILYLAGQVANRAISCRPSTRLMRTRLNR